MEPFLELEVGDEIEILSDNWDISLYNLSNIGDTWNSVGKVVTVSSIKDHHCPNAPHSYYKAVRYRDNRGAVWVLPPISSVIRPIGKGLFYYSRSHFIKFDAKVNYHQRIIKANLHR